MANTSSTGGGGVSGGGAPLNGKSNSLKKPPIGNLLFYGEK